MCSQFYRKMLCAKKPKTIPILRTVVNLCTKVNAKENSKTMTVTRKRG